MSVQRFDGTVLASAKLDDDGRHRRTGNLWTASAHIITAVIGSGVLSLPWVMAQLGWVAGGIFMFIFAVITGYCSLLLSDGYRSPDPVTGTRNCTYKEVVKGNLGSGGKYKFCAIIQYVNLVGTAIGYTITASISMVAIERSNCFHREGRHAPCHVSNNKYMLIFGASQFIFSHIPNLHKMWWLSIVAAVMSFTYSSIGLGLALGKTTEKHHSTGTFDGASIPGLFKDASDTWKALQSLGDVAFAYAFSMVLVEIEDTIKGPAENKTMKKASIIGVFTTTIFYMLVGFLGFSAFGVKAPGNLLTGFGFYEPYWLVDIGNFCIVVHLVGAYQVFAQPFFAFVEGLCERRWPKSSFIVKKYKISLLTLGSLEFTYFSLLWRTIFVVFTTIVSMIIPFFNDVVGLLGALAFFPLTVYFPTEIKIVQGKISPWTRKWIGLKSLSTLALIISAVAFVGSCMSIVDDLKKTPTPFKSK